MTVMKKAPMLKRYVCMCRLLGSVFILVHVSGFGVVCVYQVY